LKDVACLSGAGAVGKEFQKHVARHSGLGLQLVGFLDDNAEKRVSDKNILGSLEDMRAIIQREDISDVIFALPRRAYDRVNQLVADLHTLPVKVWIIPDYFSLALHRASVEEFAGLPMLDLRAPALTDYQRTIKRTFDIVITVGLTPFILPLAGLIALAIRLDNAGPILYRQKRVGENGRLFEMLKFA
jgi:FlaA1/EpsC-like NDP-sugar epimerase